MALDNCDKDLFSKFRDGKLTLAQFRCKVIALAFDTHYTVLDDLRGVISDEFLKPPSESMKKRLEMVYYNFYMKLILNIGICT